MLAARATLDDAEADAPLELGGDIEEVEVLLRICGWLAPKDLGRLASFGRKSGWPAPQEAKEMELTRPRLHDVRELGWVKRLFGSFERR
eukprot:COSAG06_NODE_4137_length_4534_cov_58.088613_5_plen_89_part_00